LTLKESSLSHYFDDFTNDIFKGGIL
jgi:hypothetical protein